MKASVVDLRYRMKDVLRALERNEAVTVLHRGEVKGTIQPLTRPTMKASAHPFFASLKDESSVREVLDELRGPRYGL